MGEGRWFSRGPRRRPGRRFGREGRTARQWRFGAISLAALLLLWVGASSASAHSVLVESDPPNGAGVPTAPAAVTLRFDEEVVARLCTARLVDGTGQNLAGVEVTGTSDPSVLAVRIPHTGSGSYSLLWRVMSADDGHLTDGVVVYTVGAATGTGASPGAFGDSGAGSVALRWLTLAGLAMALGATVMTRVLGGITARVPSGGPHGIGVLGAARLGGLAVTGTAVALAGSGIDLATHAQALSGPAGLADALGTLVTETTWGRLWVGQALALAIVLLLLSRSVTGRRAGHVMGTGSWLAIGLVAVAATAEALEGHAAALPSGVLAAQVVAVVHVLAALVWVGGVLSMLVLLAPGGTPVRAVTVRAVAVRRWRIGTLFVASTTLLAASGLVSAGVEVPDLPALLQTDYGRALLVKLAVVVPLFAVAAANASVLHGIPWSTAPADVGSAPRVPRPGSLLGEVGLGAAVLVVAAVLLNQVPARNAVPPPPTGHDQIASRSIDDLVLSLSGTPGVSGSNGLTLRVASTRRPEPAPVEQVSVVVRQGGGTEQVPMSSTEPGIWFAVVDLRAAPDLTVSPVVTRAGRQLSTSFPWSVSASATRPADRGSGLAPWADALAVLVLLVGGCGLTFVRRLRVREAGDRPQPGGRAQPGDLAPGPSADGREAVSTPTSRGS
jgi:copper transport protein